MATSLRSDSLLLNLPPEVLTDIFTDVISGGSLFSLALANHQCKKITDDILNLYWSRLKSPKADLPEGLVDLKHLIGRIDQSDSKPNTSSLFHALMKEFAKCEVALPKGMLPLTPVELRVLQGQAESVAPERALNAIWPKIVEQLHSAPKLQSVDAIRTWLLDPKNALFLNGITELDLPDLDLRVLPPEISRFGQLQRLNLRNNQLQWLPNTLFALTELQNLDLRNNKLRLLPAEIGALAKLKILDLQNNMLQALPDAFWTLPELEWLNLNDNHLGVLPDKIKALNQLKGLGLKSNQLSSIPDEIWDLTCLVWLTLSDNHLSSLPAQISCLTRLNELHVDSNHLRSLPDAVWALPQLKMLEIKCNRLTLKDRFAPLFIRVRGMIRA